jgi:N-acyl-D-aspartate/D-glutamate deacylase
VDSLDRGGLGVNAASMVPYSPLRAYVLGNEAARDPDYIPTGDEMATLKRLLREAMKVGGFGFSGTFSMANRLRWRLFADPCGAARRNARDGGGVARVQSRLD